MNQTEISSTLPLTAAFKPAANTNMRSEAALMLLAGQLVRQGARIEEGLLQLPLSPYQLKYGRSLFDAVAANLGLKERIRLNGRRYEDVVWDISERGQELARILYKEERYRQPLRIVITPPMLGPDADHPDNIVCKTFSYQGKKGEVSLRTVIETESKWSPELKKSGTLRIIQTNRLSLEERGDNFYHLKIPACAGQHHGWSRKTEIPSHDHRL